MPVPLFEMVDRDCIAAYGKYSYDVMQSARDAKFFLPQAGVLRI